jgi:hypothetical protein
MPTLRFVFTGICALTPGWPRDTSTPTSVTAVMPDSRRGRIASDETTNIAAHAPFLFVPLENLASTSRGADYVLTRTFDDLECAVIFLDREELTTSPSPTNALEYVIGEDPIGERPTTGNVTDIRWAADFREIDAAHASLKSGCVGTPPVNPKVAARVRVDGGTVTSRFPCPEGPSSTILNSPNTIHRQFAQEIVVAMEFASNVTEVVLESALFDSGATPAPDIVLQFIEAADIEVLFGNGPLESILNLKDNDCAGHEHPGAIDYEFEIYYDIIDFPAETALPVPQTDEAELRHIDCFAMFVD